MREFVRRAGIAAMVAASALALAVEAAEAWYFLFDCDSWPDRRSAPIRALCSAGADKEVDAMAIGMLLSGEAITQDSYTELSKKMFGSYPMPEDQSPEGLMLHTAGQSEQGWYVYDVWESKDHFQRFVENKLGPAIRELGADGDSQPQPQFFPVETLVKGPAL